MLLLILLVLTFWVVLPGLLTGWMLREHGRPFHWGLLIGALGGPAGILAALAFILATARRAPRVRPHDAPRVFRSFYIVPFVGRLHVSTAWAVAGVVAFLCAWMIAGLGYEFYAARQRRVAPGLARTLKPETNREVAAVVEDMAPNHLREDQKPSAPAPVSPAAQPAGPLLSGLAAQTGQTTQVSGSAANTPAQAGQTPSGTTPGGLAVGATPAAPAAAPSATAPPAPPSTPARTAGPDRAAAVSEVMRGLGGHKVHVAVSGDAQTATLSVSGPTLTRQVGSQLVGRSRQSLKAAGIRIVVINNGPESWTYIL